MRDVRAGPGYHGTSSFPVRSLEMFSLSKNMFANSDTLEALQIVRSELHPNRQVWGPGNSGGGTKESLSAYSLFPHLASTPQGRGKLKRIFLRPSLDLDLIRHRQETIKTFLRPENFEALVGIRHCLKRISNIRPSLGHLKGIDLPAGARRATIASGVWGTLQTFACFSLRLKDAVSRLLGASGLPVVRKVSFEYRDMRSLCSRPLTNAQVMTGIQCNDIHHVFGLIKGTIDHDQSKEKMRITIASGGRRRPR